MNAELVRILTVLAFLGLIVIIVYASRYLNRYCKETSRKLAVRRGSTELSHIKANGVLIRGFQPSYSQSDPTVIVGYEFTFRTYVMENERRVVLTLERLAALGIQPENIHRYNKLRFPDVVLEGDTSVILNEKTATLSLKGADPF